MNWFCFQLIRAVEYFSRNGKKVLVLGRQHMRSWPRMEELVRSATCYLLKNLYVRDVINNYYAINVIITIVGLCYNTIT